MYKNLFRGKRKDNGEWIKGNLLEDVESGICAIVSYVNLGGDIHDLSEICIFDVIPETVGRYIGLTDRNRVKIFEGDIVYRVSEYPSPTFIVLWDNKNAAWYLRANGYTTDFYHYFGDDFKIIANIHDNPELLREASQV